MTFNDIFKSSFLENITAVSILDIVLSMVLAFGIGCFIFLVYKATFRGVMYSSAFGVTLITLTMISTFVILAVTSNVVLSLGMVGALSIVRFRTAIKEPLDITFLFWSIASGIVLAAGMIPLAVFGSLLIGLTLVLFVNKKVNDTPYILVVRCGTEQQEQTVTEYLNRELKKPVIKNKTVSADGIELNIELRLKENSTAFVNQVAGMEGVSHAVLVSYNGQYMG
ncbi:MAG TPA: DUF4956 domain-containing protein [Candidatus Butyricicoccus stercorigallinarum]|nr:DUF4956 domain-containing protein [Candidatus Butyricicoccus stercorigallinarum]